MSYDDYFSETEIIALVCRYRVNCASKRHKTHMLGKVSKNEAIHKTLRSTPDLLSQLKKITPPQRKWSRSKFRAAQISPKKIAEESIRATIAKHRKQEL